MNGGSCIPVLSLSVKTGGHGPVRVCGVSLAKAGFKSICSQQVQTKLALFPPARGLRCGFYPQGLPVREKLTLGFGFPRGQWAKETLPGEAGEGVWEAGWGRKKPKKGVTLGEVPSICLILWETGVGSAACYILEVCPTVRGEGARLLCSYPGQSLAPLFPGQELVGS